MKKGSFAICCLLLAATIHGYAQLTIDTSAYVKNNPGIYSIIVSKNDRTIYQRFFNQHTANDLFNDQSLTKSIVSLLIGIAIDKGYIRSVDEKIIDFFPELKNDTDKRKRDITIRQVMNQASGLYHEDLERIPEFLRLPNPSAFVLRSPLVSDPGKIFHYSNAASHLLSVILTKSTHMNTRSFAQKFLFGPMGITTFDWAKMQDGYYDGSGLLSIRLHSQDMVKIGALLLQEGKYGDKQIVPQEWVNGILHPAIFYATEWGFDQSTYALCWYHAVYKGTPITYALGWGGQFLILIPSLQSIIVTNENTADATAIKNSITFTRHIFPLIFGQLK